MDPFLTITDAASGEVLAEDDDGGDGLNARAVIPVQGSARRITIAVSQFTSDMIEMEDTGGGTFDLRLTSFVPQPAQPIGWGQSIAGTLDVGTTREFRFTGEQGMVLEAGLLADEESGFDPYLQLLGADGAELLSDDDGGEGLNARLRYLMPDAGPFTIVASGYGEGGGAFTLRMAERREPIAQLPQQVIGLADTATGRLGLGYANGGLDPVSIDYQLSDAAIAAIRQGTHEVTIRMSAAQDTDNLGGGLDSYLELGFETPLGFAVVDSDDDGGGDLNAMIPVDLAGVASDEAFLRNLRIRAQAFAGSMGDYTLVITEGMEERADPEAMADGGPEFPRVAPAD